MLEAHHSATVLPNWPPLSWFIYWLSPKLCSKVWNIVSLVWSSWGRFPLFYLYLYFFTVTQCTYLVELPDCLNGLTASLTWTQYQRAGRPSGWLEFAGSVTTMTAFGTAPYEPGHPSPDRGLQRCAFWPGQRLLGENLNISPPNNAVSSGAPANPTMFWHRFTELFPLWFIWPSLSQTTIVKVAQSKLVVSNACKNDSKHIIKIITLPVGEFVLCVHASSGQNESIS